MNRRILRALGWVTGLLLASGPDGLGMLQAQPSIETESEADQLESRVFQAVEEERYAEAQQILDEWERRNPADQRIPKLRRLISELDAQLEELGPQDLGEKLCLAAAEGNVAQVLTLLDRGADPNARDQLRTSALHHAANFGHAEVIRILVRRGGDPNAKGLLEVTPLMLAAGKGHAEAVKALIEAGADVHAKAETGSTALMRAEQSQHAEAVELLRQAGATE